jgi:hypothetical protein
MVRYIFAFPPRIDRRRPADGLEPPALEEALAHKIEQAEHRQCGAVRLGRDADQD